MQSFQFFLLALSVFAAGCATTKPRHVWTERALQAENAQHEGRLDEAERAYASLLPEAPDDDRRRWVQFNVAHLALDRGDTAQAQTAFARLYRDERRDRYGANALYEVAKLAGDDEAIDARLAVVHRYPEEVAAEFALKDIVRIMSSHDQLRELEALLITLAPDVADTEVGDNVWFELAMLRHRDLADANGALDAYRELFARYEDGPLADDALWEMANIYREHQMWEPALALLEIIAGDVKTSWFIGSYNSGWLDGAMYDIGWIKLLYLGDYDGAIHWFKRYLKKFPHGLLSDDAAWNIVEARRLSGDEERYQKGLREFIRAYPESRYVRQATVRLGSA